MDAYEALLAAWQAKTGTTLDPDSDVPVALQIIADYAGAGEVSRFAAADELDWLAKIIGTAADLLRKES